MKCERAAVSLMAAALLAGVSTSAWASAPPTRQPSTSPVKAWTQRVINTGEFGVESPTGLTVDPVSDVIYMIGDDSDTLVGITPAAEPAGEIAWSGIVDPLNVAFDATEQRVLAVTRDEVQGRDVSSPTRQTPDTIDASHVADPVGTTVDPASGDTYILDGRGNHLVRIDDGGHEQRVALSGLAGQKLRGIAYNPADGLVYVASASSASIFSVDASGAVVETYDMSGVQLADPQAMTFADTTDPTDDPAEQSLLIADAGTPSAGGTNGGSIVEISLSPQPLAVQPTISARLVPPVTNTPEFVPSSPDPSGITYIQDRGHLLVSDGEVDEMSIFQDVNLWELTLARGQVDTGVTVPTTDEPSGASYNPANQHVYFSDDTGAKSVYDFAPGPDGRYGTTDDTAMRMLTGPFGSTDPEGLAFDPGNGYLYVVDGVGREVYVFSPGPDGLFNDVGDTLVAQFDVERYGALDPEGIAYNQLNDTLLMVDHASHLVYEMSVAGDLVRTIDISVANGRKEAGIVLAPASNGSGSWNMYIVARGVDNDFDPNENDGRLYEFAVDFGTGGNAPVALDDLVAVTAQAVRIDVVANDHDVDGDLDVASAAPIVDPVSGTAVGNADGTITYTPFGGFVGEDHFEYQVCDTTALCATATVTVNVGAPGSTYYLSLRSSASVPGIAGMVRDEDVIAFDPLTGSWTMCFDGSDVGLGPTDIDALHVRSDGSILMSFTEGGVTIPGLTGGPPGEPVDGSDVVLFSPTSVGTTTAGSFSFYFDGSDVGLTTNGEDIDGLYEFPDQSLAISTSGSISVPGVPKGKDEDVHRFSGAFGAATTGTWSMYFDGSDVGFTTSGADLNAIAFDESGRLLFSTAGTYVAAGGSGDDEDVSTFTGTFSDVTTGSASRTLDLSNYGLDPANAVDALSLG